MKNTTISGLISDFYIVTAGAIAVIITGGIVFFAFWQLLDIISK